MLETLSVDGRRFFVFSRKPTRFQPPREHDARKRYIIIIITIIVIIIVVVIVLIASHVVSAVVHRPRRISDDAALRGEVRTGKAAVAPAGEPGRRAGVPAAQLVANDARGRGRGVQPSEAGAGAQGLHADDRADQHVQHTERDIGRTPAAAAAAAAPGRRPGRQLPVAAAAGRQLPGAAGAAAGRRAAAAAAAALGPGHGRRAQLHQRGLAAHVGRGHVQLPGAAAAAVDLRHQLPGAHQRAAVRRPGRRVVARDAFVADRLRRRADVLRLPGDGFQRR